MNNGGNGNNGSNGSNNGSLFDFTENIVVPEEIGEFSNKNSTNRFLANLLIKSESFETDGSSDASTAYFRKRPSRYEHPLWSLGWTDGRLGQPRETNEALLLAHGKVRRNQAIQAMKTKLSLNEAKLPDLTSQLMRLRDHLSNATSHYTSIVNERAGRFHDFSYALGAFYIFVAVILFLSDIPLTLKLVAKGFDLKTDQKNVRTGQVLFGVDDLLTKTASVVSALWEPLALALGIALAGVFIKIFLDDVIFRDANVTKRKRVVTLSLIGLLFLATIGVLGVFRAQTQDTLSQENLVTRRNERIAQLTAQGLAKEEAEERAKNEITARKESLTETVTFVLLTMTLPLVAGVCFSSGWRRLKDTQRYHQLRREIKKLERALETASSSFHSALSELESAKTWLSLNADDSTIDAETQQELNLYRHGYLRGVNVPETIDHGLTLYDRVQRSAQKILAKRLKERLWSDVQVPNP